MPPKRLTETLPVHSGIVRHDFHHTTATAAGRLIYVCLSCW